MGDPKDWVGALNGVNGLITGRRADGLDLDWTYHSRLGWRARTLIIVRLGPT